ncbi:SAM-dependent methyltransferase [Citreimonas sp.]|uniref:SAM-dependent methyltransferase n=1 Tax=Citreimonas sp. TaxID=3036715 RepID=UPI0035C7FDF5
MSDLERWETRFGREDYHFGTEPNAFLADQADRLPASGRALAIADGEGRNGVWLAGQGLEVLSQDFSPAAQAKARRLAEARGVALRFERSDLRARDWEDAEYDVVAGIFFQFLTPEERAPVFAAMKRALKPGGLLLIEGYGPRQMEYRTGGPGKPEHLYTPALLRDAFGDMAQCDIRDHDAQVEEGAGHSGLSHLVDLVAVC